MHNHKLCILLYMSLCVYARVSARACAVQFTIVYTRNIEVISFRV